ncbi:hypothetical protein H5410_028363 [Solanum commersonii]|uniref:Uncharacterized protein n=1 Tax=Solanum commersonii TaxID=4109 RepID=A0A9J5Z4Q7_SOLCO|nr:hypothetical protein H5410_028363 [Solanum commersonii]
MYCWEGQDIDEEEIDIETILKRYQQQIKESSSTSTTGKGKEKINQLRLRSDIVYQAKCTMHQLMLYWLQDNDFSGKLLDTICDLDLSLNENQLTVLIPQGLVNLNLTMLDLSDNMLISLIPKYKVANAIYSSISFS